MQAGRGRGRAPEGRARRPPVPRPRPRLGRRPTVWLQGGRPAVAGHAGQARAASQQGLGVRACSRRCEGPPLPLCPECAAPRRRTGGRPPSGARTATRRAARAAALLGPHGGGRHARRRRCGCSGARPCCARLHLCRTAPHRWAGGAACRAGTTACGCTVRTRCAAAKFSANRRRRVKRFLIRLLSRLQPGWSDSRAGGRSDLGAGRHNVQTVQ